MDDDTVFRALADPTRRALLDRLFERDGQTLGELERRLPMTRFGVMKHVRVLAAAGLVITRRRGRQTLHFLNAVPIRLVHDRWVGKFAEPIVAAMSELKHSLEGAAMERIYEIYIKTTPQRLWDAIVDPRQRAIYSFGAAVVSAWTPGSAYTAEAAGAPAPLWHGENLEVESPRRLVQTFIATWGEDVAREAPSRVTWEIEPIGDSCRLTVTHDRLREGANPQLFGGWPMVLSGLKTWLETGETLTTPASLMYAPQRA